MEQLTSLEELIETKYGKKGTPERDQFDADSLAFRLGIMLKEARKEANLTQDQLAQRTGTKKSYISRIERGLLPVFCDLTDAKTHEVTIARTQVYPKGSVLVFDRGYTDFDWWNVLDSTGVFFVTRAKSNLDYRILQEHQVPHKYRESVKGDYTIQLLSDQGKRSGLNPLRLVRFYDKELDRSFEFLTNQRFWTASDVALAYKERWHIEVFFKFIKQNLSIKSFVSTSPNAVLTQIWTGLIAFLLLKYLQHKAAYKWALSNLVSFIRLACFAKVSLIKWLDHPFEVEKPPPKATALTLF